MVKVATLLMPLYPSTREHTFYEASEPSMSSIDLCILMGTRFGRRPEDLLCRRDLRAQLRRRATFVHAWRVIGRCDWSEIWSGRSDRTTSLWCLIETHAWGPGKDRCVPRLIQYRGGLGSNAGCQTGRCAGTALRC